MSRRPCARPHSGHRVRLVSHFSAEALEERRLLAFDAGLIDFETDAAGNLLATGQVIDNEFAAAGITIRTSTVDDPDGKLGKHPAMIFNTAQPTGDDYDLQAPGFHPTNTKPMGKVLIISEDANSANPDDNEVGGKIIFNFATPLTVRELDILDIDTNEGYNPSGGPSPSTISTVEAYNASGGLITAVPLKGLGNNSFQTAVVNAGNVSKLVVAFRGDGSGSGAVAALRLGSVPGPTPTPAIDIEKYVKKSGTSGLGDDADTPTGPQIEVGSGVVWTYVVKNTGQVAFSSVTVTDDTAVVPVLKSKASGDQDNLLEPGEVWTYEATGTAVAGQQKNVGTVVGSTNGTTRTDTDPAHYFGTTTKPGPGPVTPGTTATIGFWHNKNGQALIKSFNGSATSTALGNWLATTFPKLYGAQAGAKNLAGKTNNQVAALFLQLFSVQGQKLDAQVLGVALGVYATTSSLGGNAGTRYGFKVSAGGLGAMTWNVGSGGAAFGVPNNSTLTVLQLLKAANDRAVNGVLYGGSKSLRDAANAVFSGINEAGDI